MLFNQDKRKKDKSNEKTAKFKENRKYDIDEHKDVEGREGLI